MHQVKSIDLCPISGMIFLEKTFKYLLQKTNRNLNNLKFNNQRR